MEELLKNVKIRLGIDDEIQDELLRLLIKDAESHLKLIIESESIPNGLDFVVENVVVTKFNRRGSEGFKTESLGEHSVTIDTDDFKPYVSILDKFIINDGNYRKGRAVFF